MTGSEQCETLVTRSGLRLSVRPVSRDDGPMLKEFFAQVTIDDLRFRFLSGVNSVSDAQIAAMIQVDHKTTEDFLAFLEDGTLAATALVARDDAGDRAEVAVVVRADCKGKGIGWTMLDHVAAYARAKGVTTLEAVESRQNQKALAVERDSGFSFKPYEDDSTLVVVTRQLR